ncbi:hypothetical protein SAMN05443668_111237 [Cryptosporangium aurantiacum]|uniref:Uncharacterized protein n=2 Tax=Cryptosporangium aurantiacum TaxID=134849 RepID=A0A1M7RGK1_9ACTN|nr:hypothetical protein SAMN05443668_111237 [Cryptosporangium aurantiacum]
MVVEEIAWAAPGARAQLKNYYWEAWKELVSANATLQLASRHDLVKTADGIMNSAREVDNCAWDMIHKGQVDENEYKRVKNTLTELRDRFVAEVRPLAAGSIGRDLAT